MLGSLIAFLQSNKQFFSENGLHIYEITRLLDIEEQKGFVANIENSGLTLNEKREILATLDTDVKQSIDMSNLPEQYKSALSIEAKKYVGKIVLDLERDLEDYRGLDNLLQINPQEFTKEQRAKFIKVCDICPDLRVVNVVANALESVSTTSEYKEAEEWIDSVIDSIDPECSKAQKMALIVSAIGKKISYSPDFDTEVSNTKGCRAIWKVISSGYGVCNGISAVAKYILDRVGIESEIVGSGRHAFLKIKDIELPLASGEVVKGNTILDITWDLARYRFGGKPR